MSRRTHRKSRNGCRECKRRHIKCDEIRPICSNCTSSGRTCGYDDRIWIVERSNRPATRSSRASSVNQARGMAPAPSSSPIPDTHSNSSSNNNPVNLHHIQLFYHLMADTIPSFTEHQSIELMPPDLMQRCLSIPYLVNQMLALSALHLSAKHYQAATDPESEPEPECNTVSESFRHQAAQLQTHALALFNSIPHLQVTEENSVPLFLFSSFLGLHNLCEALAFRNRDHPIPRTATATAHFDPFLDRFVHCLRLQHGAKFIISESWAMLRESALKPMLQAKEARFGRFRSESLSPPCQKLWERIQARMRDRQDESGSDSTQKDLETYRVSIKMLQLVMNVSLTSSSSSSPSPSPSCSHSPAPSPSTQSLPSPSSPKLETDREGEDISGVMGWLKLLSVEYIDLLERREPEAMVILAFYAVMLHVYRSHWCFGGGGKLLIVGIGEYLGEKWKDWLEWPNRVIEENI